MNKKERKMKKNAKRVLHQYRKRFCVKLRTCTIHQCITTDEYTIHVYDQMAPGLICHGIITGRQYKDTTHNWFCTDLATEVRNEKYAPEDYQYSYLGSVYKTKKRV